MQPIVKNYGLNDSEKYLVELSEKTFLDLWSYPNTFKRRGDELADLIVIHGRNIIIFSDKDIGWCSTKTFDVAWKRWYRSAVEAGARAAVKAARWLKEHPERVFLDAAAKNRIPFDLTSISDPVFHLISVSSGVDHIVKQHFSDRSGTLMLSSHVSGDEHYDEGPGKMPYFTIGDVMPQNEFVHVMSRSALEFVLGEFDTVTDFIDYLNWRKIGIRGKRLMFAAGEEELVAIRWARPDDARWSYTDVHRRFDSRYAISAFGGLFHEMSFDPDYLIWKDACEKSKLWDLLISDFSRYVISGEVPVVNGFLPSFEVSERILRVMASESRAKRVVLSNSYSGMIDKAISEDGVRFVRKFPLLSDDATHGYVFLLTKHDEDEDYDEHRNRRADMLAIYCLDMLHQFPQLEHVIGIAKDLKKTVTRTLNSTSDAMITDRPVFDDELLRLLESMRAELSIEKMDVPRVKTEIKKIKAFAKKPSNGNTKARKAFRI